jgi:carbonic anhydrase/acetyltransferase-like protein (isoleucine patch superfamily)
MDYNFQNRLSELLDKSHFVKAIQTLKKSEGKSRLFADDVRHLSGNEVELLIAQGNISPDWSKILVASGFKTDFIRNNHFQGECVLGVFSGTPREIAPGVMVPDGIYNSTIICCEIGSKCLIKNCGVLANYCIKENAIIFHTGSISATKSCTFGNGVIIPVGMETGGREVVSCAEIDVTIAEQVAMKKGDKKTQESYNDFTKCYRENITCDFGIVETNACIRNTSEIQNSFIGINAEIDGALLIDNCAILSGPEEPTAIGHGAFVKNSCIQWGCEINSMAIVVDSILTEHSHVERHGKVTASIIGPNTGIAEGEVTSCLIGPFVGFHHQSLLIAALWPEGKGNVAYGANVGSNHTSRAPDQEIFCGEGVFFGLGVNIKFPSDFSQSPYSIIATGVNTMPQKIEFPFSLIQSPSQHFPGVLPSYNEIIPAWVLTDNIYMLLRNEGKYKKRNKAKRTQFEFTVFRPDIIEKMLAARNKLRSIKRIKKAYTGKDIPGIGKNVLREDIRNRAIMAYNLYIEYYCLLGLKDRITEIIDMTKKDTLNSIYKDKTEAALWEHQRALLVQEGFGKRSFTKNLSRLVSILESIADNVLHTKEKDDIRGTAIIPDYQEAYAKAGDDSFVKNTRIEMEESVKKIKKIIKELA